MLLSPQANKFWRKKQETNIDYYECGDLSFPAPPRPSWTHLLALLEQLSSVRTRVGRRKVTQLRLLMRLVLLMLMRRNGAYDELVRFVAIDRLLPILGIVSGCFSSRTAMIRIDGRLLAAHLSLVFGRFRFQLRGGGAAGIALGFGIECLADDDEA